MGENAQHPWDHCRTAYDPMASRLRHASRGQALILAVLIMFLLVGLTGLFIAMLNHAMIQSARTGEQNVLEDIARAGLQFAQAQLVNSPDGAEWQPDEGPDRNNPGWIHHGNGFFHIMVSYGPTIDPAKVSTAQANPLEKYLKVDVEARYALPNPPQFDNNDDPELPAYQKGYTNANRFLVRKVTALMPLGLTDQLLWETNLSGSPDPIALGSTLNLQDMNIGGGASGPYYPLYEGPIRVDGSVQLGSLAVYLTKDGTSDAAAYASQFKVARDDQVLIDGRVAALPDSANPLARALSNHAGSVADDPSGIDLLHVGPGDLGSVQTLETNPVIKPIAPPRLDQLDRKSSVDRYRVLTRDSGLWKDDIINKDGSSGNYAGVVGNGKGLYINNPDDIQYGGDLQALQKEWLTPEQQDASCWQDGIYDPVGHGKAVEMILHDWMTDDQGNAIAPPVIELRSTDPQAFYDSAQREWVSSIRIPYPKNGVVFAEGNLVVKGAVPSSTAFASAVTDPGGGKMPYHAPLLDSSNTVQLAGGTNTANGNIAYYVDDYNRRFDLTVVSAGTVYIEGNVLGPATRHATYIANGTVPTAITSGSVYDSKIALMAMDNVCLNPTRLVSVSGGETETIGNERVWRISHNNPLTMNFSVAGDAGPVQLLLRDGGEYRQPISDDYAVVQMRVNDQPYVWSPNADPADQTKFYFSSDDTRTAIFPWLQGSLKDAQWDSTLFPLNDFRQSVLSGSQLNLLPDGRNNVLSFALAPESGADYLISAGNQTLGPGFVMTSANVQVDALIYAQQGSWFVIPGKYYNDDKTLVLNAPFPQYREPLDVRIVINGAIVENRPASQEARDAWTMHWRGSNSFYAATDALDPKNYWDGTAWRWTTRRAGIEYHYDATLNRPVSFATVNGAVRCFPRLPKLPVSPTVFSFGAMRGA